MSDGFISAFDKAFGKALAKALANGMANQDQEQKQDEEQQEQEKKEDSSPQKKSSPATKRPPPLKRPDDVTEDTWMAFVALRKAKKAPLSGIALDRMRAEAGKAKITIDEAMQTCCLRGWTGFKAEWHPGVFGYIIGALECVGALGFIALRLWIASGIFRCGASYFLSLFPFNSLFNSLFRAERLRRIHEILWRPHEIFALIIPSY